MKTCKCGHDISAHVYHTGACRPGFVCQAACTAFNGVETLDEKLTRIDGYLLEVSKLVNEARWALSNVETTQPVVEGEK